MYRKGEDISIWLYLSKLIKVARMRYSYILPTLTTKAALKIFECPYGRNLNVSGKLFLRPNGRGSIKLGDNVTIVSRFLSNSVGITNPTFLECIEKGRIE